MSPSPAVSMLAKLESDDPPDLNTLLSDSRTAHGQMQLAKRDGHLAEALAWMQTAYQLRLTAHERDPEHADGAWRDEGPLKFKHAEVLSFYETQLLRNA